MMQALIGEQEIRLAVASLGKQIATEFRDEPLTVLGVLTGSIVFLADLIRSIDLPHRVGLIQASSYRGATTVPLELRINNSLLPDIRNRSVLLVDDIFDTGSTLSALHSTVQAHEPRRIRSAVLLWKTGKSKVDIQPDYHCFQIPDRFVVGYGLDYNDDYRHLPFIAALEPGDA
ncbi:MAG: hypoxanthine phosphoribosyltransferase [Pirellulaceae bacterium]